MKVKELIEILKGLSPDAPVVMEVNTGFAEESSFMEIGKAHMIEKPDKYTDQKAGTVLLIEEAR